MTRFSAGCLDDDQWLCVLQASASAPLLQGVRKAVRVSVVAMGAAPLAPPGREPGADQGPSTDEQVRRSDQRLPAHASPAPGDERA